MYTKRDGILSFWNYSLNSKSSLKKKKMGEILKKKEEKNSEPSGPVATKYTYRTYTIFFVDFKLRKELS